MQTRISVSQQADCRESEPESDEHLKKSCSWQQKYVTPRKNEHMMKLAHGPSFSVPSIQQVAQHDTLMPHPRLLWAGETSVWV